MFFQSKNFIRCRMSEWDLMVFVITIYGHVLDKIFWVFLYYSMAFSALTLLLLYPPPHPPASKYICSRFSFLILPSLQRDVNKIKIFLGCALECDGKTWNILWLFVWLKCVHYTKRLTRTCPSLWWRWGWTWFFILDQVTVLYVTG